MDKRAYGQFGEDVASSYLLKKGYKIITKNYRTRFGEIDLIAEEGEYLVFIEVKARGSTKYGMPEEAVSPGKIIKIKKVAEHYIAKNNISKQKCRIDVVAIEIKNKNDLYFRLIKNV